MTAPLAASVQAVNCGDCWTGPGQACGDGYDHLGRYLRAARRGFISHAELQRAIGLSVTVNGVQVIQHADGHRI